MSVIKSKRNIASTEFCFNARKFYLYFLGRKPSLLKAFPNIEFEYIRLLELSDKIFEYTVEAISLNRNNKKDISTEIKLLKQALLSLAAFSGKFSCFTENHNFKESFVLEVSNFLNSEQKLLEREIKHLHALYKKFL